MLLDNKRSKASAPGTPLFIFYLRLAQDRSPPFLFLSRGKHRGGYNVNNVKYVNNVINVNIKGEE